MSGPNEDFFRRPNRGNIITNDPEEETTINLGGNDEPEDTEPQNTGPNDDFFRRPDRGNIITDDTEDQNEDDSGYAISGDGQNIDDKNTENVDDVTKADESDKPYPDNMKPKDNTPDTQPPPKNDTGPPEDNSKPSNPFDQQPKNTDSDNQKFNPYFKNTDDPKYYNDPSMNINGHGPYNPFQPIDPTTLISSIRRDDYVIWSFNEVAYSFWAFVRAYYFDGTYAEGTWYKNSVAVGTQLYPQGLYMYYDMFSWSGIEIFFIDWVFVIFFHFFFPYLFDIPLSNWIHLANAYQGQLSLDPILPILSVYLFPLVRYFIESAVMTGSLGMCLVASFFLRKWFFVILPIPIGVWGGIKILEDIIFVLDLDHQYWSLAGIDIEPREDYIGIQAAALIR